MKFHTFSVVTNIPTFLGLDPPDALTVWVALSVSNEENGCVKYSRESHHKVRCQGDHVPGIFRAGPEISVLSGSPGLFSIAWNF